MKNVNFILKKLLMFLLQAPKPSLSIPITVNTQPSMHRIILPATSTNVTLQGSTVTSLAPIQPAPTVSIQNVNQLPPGSAILSTNATNIQGMQSFAIVPALVPASYVTQVLPSYCLLTFFSSICDLLLFFGC